MQKEALVVANLQRIINQICSMELFSIFQLVVFSCVTHNFTVLIKSQCSHQLCWMNDNGALCSGCVNGQLFANNFIVTTWYGDIMSMLCLQFAAKKSEKSNIVPLIKLVQCSFGAWRVAARNACARSDRADWLRNCWLQRYQEPI